MKRDMMLVMQQFESDASGNLTSEYVFFGGARIARRDVATGNVYYYLSDHLGSSNVVTNATGVIQNESDFYPFGGERQISNNLANQHFKFTGKERDTESGLDDFGARYYSSGMGRFMSPDWSAKVEPVPYSKIGNPQSLNLYAYVQNNAITLRDPDGHYLSDGYENELTVWRDAGFLGLDQGAAVSQFRADAFDAAVGQIENSAAQSVSGAQAQQQNANNSVPAHFEYSISTGELWQIDASGKATFVGIGYSGKGNGLNNPFNQDVQGEKDKPDAGPIPVGNYSIGKMFDNTGKTGPGSMRLTPDWGNDMNGRSDFLIHGDKSKHDFSASEGCIIMSRSVRDAISSSGITRLEVKANLW